MLLLLDQVGRGSARRPAVSGVRGSAARPPDPPCHYGKRRWPRSLRRSAMSARACLTPIAGSSGSQTSECRVRRRLGRCPAGQPRPRRQRIAALGRLGRIRAAVPPVCVALHLVACAAHPRRLIVARDIAIGQPPPVCCYCQAGNGRGSSGRNAPPSSRAHKSRLGQYLQGLGVTANSMPAEACSTTDGSDASDACAARRGSHVPAGRPPETPGRLKALMGRGRTRDRRRPGRRTDGLILDRLPRVRRQRERRSGAWPPC